MAKFYASLTGPLLGLYYPLPFDDEVANRRALNTSRLKGFWCGIYNEDALEKLLVEYPNSIVLGEGFAGQLDYDYHVTLHQERRDVWCIGITADKMEFGMIYGPFDELEHALKIQPEVTAKLNHDDVIYIVKFKNDLSQELTHRWDPNAHDWEKMYVQE